MVDYRQFNEKLVNLSKKENFDHGSLAGSMLEQFLDSARYQDNDEVIRYKTDFDEETEQLAQDLFSKVLYHINQRHFNLNPELTNQLNQSTDPNGNTISSALANHFMDTSQKSLLASLEEDPTKISYQDISNLTSGIIQKYDQNTVTQAIKEEIGENPEELRDGMRQINEEYNNLIPEDRLEKLIENKGTSELINIYWQLINEARKK